MIKRERKLFLKTFFDNFLNIFHFITEDDTAAVDADDNDVTASQQSPPPSPLFPQNQMEDPDYPGSPDEAYDPETKDPQDEAERQTKEDAEMAERCGVEPEAETVGESQEEEEAEPPKKKCPRTLRIRNLDNDSPAKTEKRCSPRKKVMKYILENYVSSKIFGFC